VRNAGDQVDSSAVGTEAIEERQNDGYVGDDVDLKCFVESIDCEFWGTNEVPVEGNAYDGLQKVGIYPY
jgi:hypothetical protein